MQHAYLSSICLPKYNSIVVTHNVAHTYPAYTTASNTIFVLSHSFQSHKVELVSNTLAPTNPQQTKRKRDRSSRVDVRHLLSASYTLCDLSPFVAFSGIIIATIQLCLLLFAITCMVVVLDFKSLAHGLYTYHKTKDTKTTANRHEPFRLKARSIQTNHVNQTK